MKPFSNKSIFWKITAFIFCVLCGISLFFPYLNGGSLPLWPLPFLISFSLFIFAFVCYVVYLSSSQNKKDAQEKSVAGFLLVSLVTAILAAFTHFGDIYIWLGAALFLTFAHIIIRVIQFKK